jgi:hypothetical protein
MARTIRKHRGKRKPRAVKPRLSDVTKSGSKQRSNALLPLSRESGGKRKGRSMRKSATQTRDTNVTRTMIESALDVDTSAQVQVNRRGEVKLIVYRRAT